MFSILNTFKAVAINSKIQFIERNKLQSKQNALKWPIGIILFFLIVFPTQALESTETSRPFSEFIGLGVKFIQGQSLDTLPMMSDLNVKWARELVNWSEIESSPGVYGSLPENLRKELAYYKEHDIGLVAILTLSNTSPAPATPAEIEIGSNPEAFGRFAAKAASLLKAEGVRFVLEVGNEPHNSHLVKALGGNWNGAPPSPWLNHYVKMVNAAVREVKAYEPTIKVIAGDDMWVIDYWLLNAGLDPRLDGLTVHPYANVPEIAAVSYDTDWVRPFIVVDPDRSFFSGIARLRAAALQKQGRPVEIWITEMGWMVAEGASPAAKATSERTAAAYLPRSFVLAAEAGVAGFCWFSSQDSVDGPMGLTRNDRSKRLSYNAFKTMSSELGELAFVKRLYGESGTLATTQAFLFSGHDGDTIVAWQAQGTETSELIIPQSQVNELMVTDFLGAKTKVLAMNGQFKFTLPLTGEPIYVRIPSGTASLMQISRSDKF